MVGIDSYTKVHGTVRGTDRRSWAGNEEPGTRNLQHGKTETETKRCSGGNWKWKRGMEVACKETGYCNWSRAELRLQLQVQYICNVYDGTTARTVQYVKCTRGTNACTVRLQDMVELELEIESMQLLPVQYFMSNHEHTVTVRVLEYCTCMHMVYCTVL